MDKKMIFSYFLWHMWSLTSSCDEKRDIRNDKDKDTHINAHTHTCVYYISNFSQVEACKYIDDPRAGVSRVGSVEVPLSRPRIHVDWYSHLSTSFPSLVDCLGGWTVAGGQVQKLIIEQNFCLEYLSNIQHPKPQSFTHVFLVYTSACRSPVQAAATPLWLAQV